MTADGDDPAPSSEELEAEADALLAAAEEAPRPRRARSFRACFACVDVGGRPLTAKEDAALRAIATALLDARAWIGSTNAWLTTEQGLLERLEFRTLAPRPAERLSYVEVTASTDRRRASKGRRS